MASFFRCLALGLLVACTAMPIAAADPMAVQAPLVVSPTQSPEQAYDAGMLRVLVPSAMTGGRYSVLELHEAAGYRTPPHVHPRMDESFYVLEGTLELQMGGATHTLPAGSFVHIPRGTAHAQGSATDQPVKLLATFSPGGFEAFFLDRVALARTVQRGDADFLPRMLEVVGNHGHWLQPAETTESD